MDGNVGQLKSTIIPAIIRDVMGIAITTLTVTDFAVMLTNPSGTVVYQKAAGAGPTINIVPVAIAHDGGGLYVLSFTPNLAGLWKIRITLLTYGIDFPGEWDIGAAVSPTAGSALTDLASVKAIPNFPLTKYLDAQIQTACDWAATEIESWCDRHFAAADYRLWMDGPSSQYLRLPEYPIISITRIATGTAQAIRLSNAAAGAEWLAASALEGTLALTIVGGALAGTQSLTLATYATMALLEVAIEALPGNWSAVVENEDDPRSIRPMHGSGEPTGYFYLYSPSDAIESYIPDVRSGMVELPSGWAHGPGAVFVHFRAGYEAIPSDLHRAATMLAYDLLRASQREQALTSEKLGGYSYSLAAGGLLDPYKSLLRHYKRLEL